MVFKQLKPALGQGLVFVCGGAAVLAFEARFYACAAVSVLVGAWMGALAVGASRRSPPSLPASAPSSAAEIQHQLLQSAFDQIPAPLLRVSDDGALRAVNRAARALFQTDDRLIAPPQPLLDALNSTLKDGRQTVVLGEAQAAHTYVLSSIDLISPAKSGRLAMLQDIQPEIRVAEAGALRDLMQVLSHEIMNALTPVASLAATAADLLADGTPKSAEIARDAVETLARRAEGLSRFVEAYRTLARLPPPLLKPTSVTVLMEEAARLFRSCWSAQGVSLALTTPRPDIIAALDRDLTVHALMNILSNGAEAALTSAHGQPWVSLSAAPREGGVVFAVKDSGPGVPSIDRDRIFQPFFTTKPEGTGVGLSFARQVALGHGGDLGLAASGPGGRAVFEFRL